MFPSFTTLTRHPVIEKYLAPHLYGALNETLVVGELSYRILRTWWCSLGRALAFDEDGPQSKYAPRRLARLVYRSRSYNRRGG